MSLETAIKETNAINGKILAEKAYLNKVQLKCSQCNSSNLKLYRTIKISKCNDCGLIKKLKTT